MSEDNRLSAEDEAAVERYARAVALGRKQGVKMVMDHLLQPKLKSYGKLIPIAIRREIVNTIPVSWLR